MKKILTFIHIVVLMLLLPSIVRAQATFTSTCGDPAQATVGVLCHYSVTRASGSFGTPTWTGTNATITNKTVSADKKTAYADVVWNQSGEDMSLIVNQSGTAFSISVIVLCNTFAGPTYTVTHTTASEGTVATGTSCSATTFTITANGGSLPVKWYDNAGVLLSPQPSGSSLTTPSISASTSYILKTYNSTSLCYSSAVAVPLNIIARPTDPTITNSYVCDPNSGIAQLSGTPGGTGDQIDWYQTLSQPETPVTGLTYSPGTVTKPKSFYATSLNTASKCQSTTRITVPVNFYQVPAAPTTTNISKCGPGSITLTATPGVPATSVEWYNSGGTVISATQNITATTTYYVKSKNVSCLSSTSTPLTVTVNPLPPIPTYPYTTTAYGHGSIEVMAYADTGYGVHWYATNNATDNNVLYTGPEYVIPGELVAQPTTQYYYAAAYNSTTQCESPRLGVIADIRPVAAGSRVTNDFVRVAGAADDAGVDALNSTQRSTEVTHFDSFNRVIQRSSVSGTTSGNDLITAIEYKDNAKSTKQYLPYAMATNNGDYRWQYQSEQSAFYNGGPLASKVVTDGIPYSTEKTEDSPLGRDIATEEPGAWLTSPGVRTKQTVYSFNTGVTNDVVEEVRKFNSDGSSSSFYAANTLNKISYTDEDGNKKIIFTNGQGQVIVAKTQGTTSNYLQTYYIYDDFGRIKIVISPKGIATLRSSWPATLSATILDNYCTQYVYDSRGRVVEKKVQGQAAMYYVYDKYNRLVLAQDGTLRAANKWVFMKYDVDGNLVMRGLYVNTTQTTRAAVKALVDGFYTGSWYESRLNNTSQYGYTNVCFPTTGTTPLIVNYYGSYDFDGDGSVEPTNKYFDSTATKWTDWYAKGLLTGTQRVVLGSATMLVTSTRYDDNGNVLEVRSNNNVSATLGANKLSYAYDFEGKRLSATDVHAESQGITVTNAYSYDPKGRLIGIQQSNAGLPNQLIAAYEYNELGQVVDKKLHNNLQSVDYRYNILGGLTSINNASLTTDSKNDDAGTTVSDLFGMELAYTTDAELGNTARYNGLVTGMKWKAAGRPAGVADRRSYSYGYDNASRLTTGTSKIFDGTNWTSEVGAQNETVSSYDENGNILTLNRYQRKVNTASPFSLYARYLADQVDNLTYSVPTGDRLDKITESASPVQSNMKGFDNGASGTSNDYTYNSDGDLLTDLNKSITNITYNELHLPTQITYANGNYIQYVYDAQGTKLKMVVHHQYPSVNTITIDYVDGFMYKDNALFSFVAPEGRVVKNSQSGYDHEYFISDHQGNNRVLFTSAAPVVDTQTASFEGSDNTNWFSQYAPNGSTLSHIPGNNHTPGGTTSLAFNGYSTLGTTKTFSVCPGDQVSIQAWAIGDTPTGSFQPASLFNLMIAAFPSLHLHVPVPTEVATPSRGLYNYCTYNYPGGFSSTTAKATITMLIFDRNYNFIEGAYSTQDVTSMTQLSITKTIQEAGYVFIYTSNENTNLQTIYWDDVKIALTPTRVLQYNEYYPFGMQAGTSWTREINETGELDHSNVRRYDAGAELDTVMNWYDLPYRNYDPVIGRFAQIDPLAYHQPSQSTYDYANNSPVTFNDPMGLIPNGTAPTFTPSWVSDLFGEEFTTYEDYWDNLEEDMDKMAEEMKGVEEEPEEPIEDGAPETKEYPHKESNEEVKPIVYVFAPPRPQYQNNSQLNEASYQSNAPAKGIFSDDASHASISLILSWTPKK